MSAQDLAQGASDQAASIQELLATVTEVTEQVVENTKTTDKAHDYAKAVGQQAKVSQDKMKELTGAMESIKSTSGEIENIIIDIEEITISTLLAKICGKIIQAIIQVIVIC